MNPKCANHARLWSLIASAERHGIDPQNYLTSVLAKLPILSADDPDTLVQFLPNAWQRDDAAEPLPPPNKPPRSQAPHPVFRGADTNKTKIK